MTARDNSQLITEQLEGYLSDASDSATLLTININNAVEELGEKNSRNSLLLFNNISNELSYAMLVFPNIDSIAYLDVTGTLHSTHHTAISRDEDSLLTSGMVAVLQETTGTDYWFNMNRRNYLVSDDSIPVLTLGKKIIEITSGKTLGYLFINISETKLSEGFINQDSHYMIIDDMDTIIASNDPDEILMSLDNHALRSELTVKNDIQKVITPANADRQLLSVSFINNSKWRLIGSADLAYLTRDLEQINLIILMMLGVILLVVIFSLNMLSSMLTRPIKDLTEDMKKVAGGDLDVVHNYDSADEIGTLTKGFNHMSGEIKELLLRVEAEQKKKREYELALIQEQIKPHFLYNCLDAIYALAMMGRQKDAAKTTKALADYYRLSLSKGQDVIPLKDELANVTNYLELQKIRYSDVFDYSIDVNPILLEERILKLSLQPIIENAIYHGLKPTEQMGYITIDSSIEEDFFYLRLTDNGQGIDKATMDTLLTVPSKEKHFGLYNVQDRLRLFFGPNYGLSISSTYGSGTTVTVKLPRNRGDI